MCKGIIRIYTSGQLLGYQRNEVLKCKAEGLGKSQCPRQRRKEIKEAIVSRERGGSAQGLGHQVQRSSGTLLILLEDESSWV